MRVLLALAVAVGVFCHPSPAGADNAQIIFSCVNPEHSMAIVDHQSMGGGRGIAATEPMQFNINQAPGRGAIFVDARNQGLCVARIVSDHIITGGHAEFRPGGSSTEHRMWEPVLPEDWINAHVHITQSMNSNKEMVFLVGRDEAQRKGSVTLTFFIEYQAAN